MGQQLGLTDYLDKKDTDLIEPSEFFPLSVDPKKVVAVMLKDPKESWIGYMPAEVKIVMDNGKEYNLTINKGVDANKIYKSVVEKLNEARKDG